MRAPGRTSIVSTRKQGRWTSSVKQKVAWMSKHGDMFHSKEELVNAMKAAGLISKKTYWRDVHIERYIELVPK